MFYFLVGKENLPCINQIGSVGGTFWDLAKLLLEKKFVWWPIWATFEDSLDFFLFFQMNVNRNLGKESANEQTVNYTMEESLNKTL